MSEDQVSREIAKFLTDPGSTVLCLRGKWGIGKTYLWDREIRNIAKHKLARDCYAYVSLFGLTSLSELKQCIVVNSQLVARGLGLPSLETLNDFLGGPKLKKAAAAALLLPAVQKFVGSAIVQGLAFTLVHDEIVCIDDVERRGNGLQIKDILGLIGFLRDQRKCKVALILNDEKLSDEDRRDFEANLEKVVDTLIRYDPDPAHVAKIGAADAEDDKLALAERCEALGITNIRVVKRSGRLISTVKPALGDLDPEVLRRAISCLCLACWCRDEPEAAPSLDSLLPEAQSSFSEAWAKYAGDTDNQSEPPRWKSRLAAYDHTWSGDLDLILIEGVKRGWFDLEKVTAEARKLAEKLGQERVAGSLEDAWRRFHNSFDADQDEVLDGIRDAFQRGVKFVSPLNLNSTVDVFKKLDRLRDAS